MQASEPTALEIAKKQDRMGFYGWYTVVVLTLCQTLSSLDSKLPFILVEALKTDLKLSDTQVGLITGPAFSLTYAICALPIAKISDRYVRTRVISIAIFLWSGLTAAGGASAGFATFALSRIGVAAGEAGLAPAAHSIIAGYTTPANRPKAMAIYALGTAIGAALALVFGGMISDRYGWRTTLYVAGAIGIFLMLLVALTVRDPAKRVDNPNSSAALPKGSLKSLLGHAAIRNIVLGGALMGLSTGAVNAWAPAYIMRSFDMSASATGASFGSLVGALGIAGLLIGGFGASWLAKKRPSNAFRMLAITLIAATAFQLTSFLVSSFALFLIFTAAAVLFTALYFAPTYAGVQSLAHPNARAFAAAVTLFAVNGIGIASGSFFAGFFSDLLRPAFGADSLRWSLIILTFMKPWGACHYYLAARAMDRTGIS